MGRGRSERTRQIVDLAYQVLEAEHPMTLRQLFYRLVSVKALENRQTDYQRLSRIMTGARERGEVPYEWMVDRSRPEYEPNVWRDPAAYVETIKNSYRRNYWQDQPWHVEVWTEKDAILGSIQPVTDELGVTVRVGRGFLSTTRAHEIAEFFNSIDKPIQVFYLGDHDPSGVCIEEDAARRVAEVFDMERLAIHREDIRAFKLPPLRIKGTDSRAAAFRRRHGNRCVELDALPPSELRDRLQKAITERIDRDKWERAIVVETAELNSLREIAPAVGRAMGHHGEGA